MYIKLAEGENLTVEFPNGVVQQVVERKTAMYSEVVEVHLIRGDGMQRIIDKVHESELFRGVPPRMVRATIGLLCTGNKIPAIKWIRDNNGGATLRWSKDLVDLVCDQIDTIRKEWEG